mgnify:CR=1 FL=1
MSCALLVERAMVHRPPWSGLGVCVQALFASLNTRLATVGRSFEPPAEVSIAAIERWWEALERTEKEYAGCVL